MDQSDEHDPFLGRRMRMVKKQLADRGIRDERVLRAMASVPRHEFLPQHAWDDAYEDHPMPIGEGQTISQPYIVAFMIEALALEASDTVLEIGAGTGYQAAVLSRIAAQVYTVERIAPLAEQARQNFARLGYHNIEVVIGNGSEGLPQFAPYKRIIVAAAASTVPGALQRQLDENGILVIPIGNDIQELQRVHKSGGEITVSNLGGCRFVPLIGG
ncbi:MAG: protein-L-isoaspartate(D-aspartate) O-methyltransferase [Candidatus Korobacteraceae bacterium]